MKWWPTKTRKPEPAEDRCIFEYWDGTQTRRMDPLTIWYSLWAHEDIDTLMKRAGNNEMESMLELANLSRELFDLPSFDGTSGMTHIEAMDVLGKYLDYTKELKKKIGPLPIPWQKLAPTPSSEDSTTPPDAESSSSPATSPPDEPSTASTPSPQPSMAQ